MHTDLAFPMVQSKQNLEIPLILDEQYDLVDTGVQHFGTDFDGGLLAGADGFPAALLSMSGYNSKAHLDDVDDFDSTKPFQDPSYGFQTQPHSDGQYDLNAIQVSQAATNVSQLAFLQQQAQQPYQPRASAEPYLSISSPARQPSFPTILSCTPQQLTRGTRVTIHIRSSFDLNGLGYTFPVKFGQKRQISDMTKIKHADQYSLYTISAEVPAFATTGCPTSLVDISMQMLNADGQTLAADKVGDFYYNTDSSISSDDYSRKRRPSEDTASEQHSSLISNKRAASSTYVRPKDEEPPMLPYSGRRSVTTYSPFLQPQPTPPGQIDMSPRQPQSAYPTYVSSTVMQPTLKPSSPGASAWSSAYTGAPRISQNPGLGITNVRTRTPGGSEMTNPPFIRTSTLHSSPSPASTPPNLVQTGQPFNPYFMHPTKAQLKIDGDLDSMTESAWTLEEWEAKRRIVRFRRRQSGSTITTTFEPVAIDDRPPNSICISCIWWEEKKECYVTSVDTIYLLESLVAVRFTVEEKNRIRRNLEGFRPLTVSKAKADSEEFFKIIMGFPNPKPRNIEKDVKVFPWKILSHALKKIIGKYSASYSSTAGALLPAAPPSGYGLSSSANSGMDAMMPQRPTPSPRSTSASTTSVTRTPSLTSLAYSPNPTAGLPYTATTPDLRVNSSSLGGQYTGGMPSITPSWPQHQQQPQQHHQQQPQQHQQPTPQQSYAEQASSVYPVTTQGPRTTWDYPSYLEASPASTGPSTQNLYYSSMGYNSTSEDMSAGRRMSHHHTTGP